MLIERSIAVITSMDFKKKVELRTKETFHRGASPDWAKMGFSVLNHPSNGTVRRTSRYDDPAVHDRQAPEDRRCSRLERGRYS